MRTISRLSSGAMRGVRPPGRRRIAPAHGATRGRDRAGLPGDGERRRGRRRGRGGWPASCSATTAVDDAGPDHGRRGLLVRDRARARGDGLPRRAARRGRPGDGAAEPLATAWSSTRRPCRRARRCTRRWRWTRCAADRAECTDVTDLRSLGMAIRSGELSPTEHVQDALDRLAADPYNLVVTLDAERALAQAAALTEELAQGRWRGPLHGVALGVKDLFDVAGLPTKCGSNVFADAPPATADAAAVAALRAAGAIVVAKLHTQEFAHGPTGRRLGHRSRPQPARPQPDHRRLVVGIGRRGRGRVRAAGAGHRHGLQRAHPGGHCGVVGLKPAFGHVPIDGVFPLAESLDHVGLLTADVDAPRGLGRPRPARVAEPAHLRAGSGAGRAGPAGRDAGRRALAGGGSGDRRGAGAAVRAGGRGRADRRAAAPQCMTSWPPVLPGDRRRGGLRDPRAACSPNARRTTSRPSGTGCCRRRAARPPLRRGAAGPPAAGRGAAGGAGRRRRAGAPDHAAAGHADRGRPR